MKQNSDLLFRHICREDIYYRTDEIMEKFNCSNKTASKIMAELEEIGLIEKKRQGQTKCAQFRSEEFTP